MSVFGVIQVFIVCAIIISGVAALLSFTYSLFNPRKNKEDEKQ